MGAHLLALFTAVFFPQDSITTYATPATRVVVAGAMTRHQAEDTTVADYRATLHYRLSMALGRRRWGHYPPVAVEEQVATVAWQRPNDLRVDIIGRQARQLSGDFELSSHFSRPWFVPRGVGDSVRIFSDEFPATGALHPLARGAEAFYHYDLTDSLAVAMPDGSHLKLYEVEVIPKRAAPALIAGRLWIAAGTHDVVRLTFRYVGTGLFVRPDSGRHDSTGTRRLNAFISRLVTVDVDVEYARQDGRYWMPFRQSVAGTVSIPLSGGMVIPFQAVSEFSDYIVNGGQGGQVVRGEWRGGRFELHRPPDDSLALYRGWTDSLRFGNAPDDDQRVRAVVADMARISEELPGDITGQRPVAISYERTRDALQYNRVQGLSLGAGARLHVPGAAFTDVYPTVRYGFSDRRMTGRLAVVRDAPGARVTVAAYHDLGDVDPFAPARSLANSVNALFTAHDNGDYYLASGGEIGVVTGVGLATDLRVTLRGERQRSVERRARSWVNDQLGGTGAFATNPPVLEGDFGIASISAVRYGAFHWTGTLEGMVGKGVTTGRAYGEVRRNGGGARGYTLRLKAGITERSAPPQMLFRLGGETTVRGFDYATVTAPSFWAAQLDLSPLRGTIRPVLFIDAGQAAAADSLFRSRALVGGGIGLSVYSPLLRATLIRMDLSHPITPDNGSTWRFDLVFSPVR